MQEMGYGGKKKGQTSANVIGRRKKDKIVEQMN